MIGLIIIASVLGVALLRKSKSVGTPDWIIGIGGIKQFYIQNGGGHTLTDYGTANELIRLYNAKWI